MKRRLVHNERSDGSDDVSRESRQRNAGPEAEQPDPEIAEDGADAPPTEAPPTPNKDSVADRLNRVTRYAASGAKGAAQRSGPSAEDGILTVGRGIRLIAKMCECTELFVEGHLEANAKARTLKVAEGGKFIGTAQVEFADIHGQFEGELTASEKLIIHAAGSVSGSASYCEIVIEAGGRIMGKSQSLAKPPPVQAEEPVEQPAAEPAAEPAAGPAEKPEQDSQGTPPEAT